VSLETERSTYYGAHYIGRLVAIEEERISLSGSTPPWVISEHLARYRFAARWVSDKTIVECSCGNGIGTREFLRAGATAIVAIDIDHGAIVEARRNTDGHGGEYVVGDATKLPVKSSTVDVFVSLETLEHVAEDRAFLDEISRVLRPGGICIISTPNRWVTHPGAPGSVRPMSRFHIREYSQAEFDRLLRARFHEVEMFGQNPQHKWQAWCFGRLARVLPPVVAARLNQLLKVRRLVRYDPAAATVSSLRPNRDYEYLVALCREPIQRD
jgi:SAM-dependent methyltransferase